MLVCSTRFFLARVCGFLSPTPALDIQDFAETNQGRIPDACWELDNLSWHRTRFFHGSREEISDIKLDDFSHIPLHASREARTSSWENPAPIVDSALPNSAHRSRARFSSFSSSRSSFAVRPVPVWNLPASALARLDLMPIISEPDGASAGLRQRVFDDVALLCRYRTTIRGLISRGRVFGLLCRSRSSWCLLRCGYRCYAFVVIFDRHCPHNLWAADLFPTVPTINEQPCASLHVMVPRVSQASCRLGERTEFRLYCFLELTGSEQRRGA